MSVQTDNHTFSMKQMYKSMLQMDVSDASWKVFFGLHFCSRRSGIDIRAK